MTRHRPRRPRQTPCADWTLGARRSWPGSFRTPGCRGTRAPTVQGFDSALGKSQQSRGTEGHHDHDRGGIEYEVVALRDAKPFGQKHSDQGADERPKEIAGAADNHHQQQVERQAEREGVWLDELHERRIQRTGQPAEARANGKGHQRISSRIETERQCAERIFPQGNEGAAPWRTEHPPGCERKKRQGAETEEIEIARAIGTPAQYCRTWRAGDAVDAIREPLLVAQHQESEGDEGEVMVLHPQRRVTEPPPHCKAQKARSEKRQEKWHAQWRQKRNRIGANSDESALRQRDLPSITESEIEPDRRDG